MEIRWGKLTMCWILAVILAMHHLMALAGTPLTDYIGHYEPVYYDHTHVEKQHHIVKRSADKEIKLDIKAHDRKFRLRLRRDPGIYTNDLVVETSEGPVTYDRSRAYIGYLQGEPESYVHGTLTSEGHFEGKIIAEEDQYAIETAGRYFTTPQDFHSIMYRHSDVMLDADTDAIKCNSDQLHRKIHNLQKTQSFRSNTAGAYKNRTDNQRANQNSSSQLREFSLDNTGHVIKNMSQSKQSIKHLFKLSSQRLVKRRSERSTDRYLQRTKRHEIDPTKTTCLLYMQADHLFFRKQGNKVEAVIEQLTQHVQGVNAIYRIIDFDKDAESDNINFIIKRIKVHTTPLSKGYKYNDRFGVEKYLELFSEDNYNDFCLAYMFTYRDFDGGTLGLAWTGDLQNAGGVCEQNGFFRGSMKSLNSGIVTTLNYGKDVPSTVSHVTLAHEIGHNMGSQHDPETQDCAPGGETGNYIMFARATSGDKPNNNKFSQCSKDSMSLVIASKARSSSGCFIIYTGSICGNEIVEAGEDCDCGWEEDCHEKCCFPQKSNPHPAEPPCTLKPKAKCSPSKGPCCTQKCEVVHRSEYKVCRNETPCTRKSYCDGIGAPCPTPIHKPNKTECDDGSVCYQGECTGSICLVYGLESCQCAPKKVGDWKDPLLCHLCCREPGEGKPCKTSMQWNHVPDLMAKPGMPCNNYMGYCDVYAKCREVDPSGPLSILRRYLFSEKGRENMKEWVIRHWYVVGGAGLGVLLFLALFIKLCSKSLPRRKRKEKLRDQQDQELEENPNHPVYPGLSKSGSSPKPLTQFSYPGLQKYGAVLGTRYPPQGLSPYSPDVVPEVALVTRLVTSSAQRFATSSPSVQHSKFVQCSSGSSASATPQFVHNPSFVVHTSSPKLSCDFMTSSQNVMTSPQNVATSSQSVSTSSQDVRSPNCAGTSHPQNVTSRQDMASPQNVMASPQNVMTSSNSVHNSHYVHSSPSVVRMPQQVAYTPPSSSSPAQRNRKRPQVKGQSKKGWV